MFSDILTTILSTTILSTIIINYILFNLIYYTSSLFFFIIDYYKYFAQYKIQHIHNPIQYYKKCFWRVITNTLLFSLVPISLFAWYEVKVLNLNSHFNLTKCIFDLVYSLILTEIFFYSIHRLLHLPYIYAYFHKEHHKIIAPIGFAAVYMTVTDFLVGNVLPVYLPLYLINAHSITIKIWMVLTTINTVVFSHSGYYLSRFHDAHHSLFNKNYGTNLFMDWIFGTLQKIE